MKNSHTVLKLVAAALLTCTAGLAAAAGSQTLAVTASVQGICKFSAASTPLAFGAIDPSLTTDKTMTANVLYKCTKGTASAGVTLATGGLNRTMTSTTAGVADTLGYTLSLTGGTQTGAGFGATGDLTLVVLGTITALQYQNASAANYAETVTLNITP